MVWLRLSVSQGHKFVESCQTFGTKERQDRNYKSIRLKMKNTNYCTYKPISALHFFGIIYKFYRIILINFYFLFTVFLLNFQF